MSGGFFDFFNHFSISSWFQQPLEQQDEDSRNIKHSGLDNNDTLSTVTVELETTLEDLEKFHQAVDGLLKESNTIQPENLKDSIPAQPYTRIPLCQQLETWDCGVACIQMILRWLREVPVTTDQQLTRSELSERDWILQTIGTESVWTIDLIFAMEKLLGKHKDQESRCSLTWLFCSTHLGVDSTYNGVGYYRNAFEKDQVRVNQLFQQAQTTGFPILCVQHHLGLTQVVRLVSRENCVAIVLLDNSILLRGTSASLNDTVGSSDGNTRKTSQQLNLPSSGKSKKEEQVHRTDTYQGHYVVLCGISIDPVHLALAQEKDSLLQKTFHNVKDGAYCLVIKNPARSNEVDFISPFLFEQSWRANGTDEDIIFIAKHTMKHESR